MRGIWPRWIKMAMWLAFIFVVGAAGLVVAVERLAPTTKNYDYWREFMIVAPAIFLLGAAILAHRPRHGIGLVLLVSGLLYSVGVLTGTFAVASSVFAWGGGTAAAWLANLIRQPTLILGFGLLFLLYPTGRPLGRIGRWMCWILVVGATGFALSLALEPGPLLDIPEQNNPLGISSLGRFFEVFGDVSQQVIALVGFAGGLAVMTVRFFLSRGAERLQMKMVLYSAIMAATGLILLGEGPLGSIAWTVAPMSVLAAMAVAIVRYRLFDIDQLISRTIGYGVVTSTLVVLYLGLVFLLGGVLPFEGELAVAASTLAVAALFNPMRREVQARVDRRFNRSRYDAFLTTESFSRRMRTDVELSDVVGDLLTATSKTMQPASLAMWLREPGR